ncbi:MAG TPA: hypothetical protein VMI75_18255 [Polyangiaceae bacterium]|nr:hypothetical protein [Polyangiaceae bacterium]
MRVHHHRRSIALLLSLVTCAVAGVLDETRTASATTRLHSDPRPETATPITSPIPQSRLQPILAALPKVAWPRLQSVLHDPNTYFYDHASLQPSYQETGSPGGGARDNADWHDLIADTGSNDPNTNPEVGAAKVYDETNKHWRFPFAGTAGVDASTNFTTVDFVKLPVRPDGTVVPIPISTASDSLHLWWQWQFPNGTFVGEVLFITDGTNLLPCEVRVRVRYPGGWATNVFRPFPEASSLSAAIKAARPAWSSTPSLAALVAQLDGGTGLSPLHLTATGLPGTFDQAGFLDPLPPFGDEDLVRTLLTKTTFVAAYDAVWRQSSDGSQQAYAASTSDTSLSIVPSSYQAGIVAVNETSCGRCHQATGQELGNWYPGLTLYGDVWGTDQIFTFHVFDESYYPDLDLDTGNGTQDNRHMNPALVSMGMIKQFDSSTDTGPPYYNRQ